MDEFEKKLQQEIRIAKYATRLSEESTETLLFILKASTLALQALEEKKKTKTTALKIVH